MVGYRRNRPVGGTFFFTLTLRDRRSDALVRHVDVLRDAWRRAAARVPHEIIAAAILPDHLHAVIRMTDDRCDYPRLWQDIKKGVSRRLANAARSQVALWQPRYWEHTIRDENDLQRHVDYVHINPLKHGLVRQIAEWPHSTFHRYVRMGDLPPNWAGVAGADGNYGERDPV